jgi:hypothetical protein
MTFNRDFSCWLSVVNSATGEVIHETWHGVASGKVGWLWNEWNDSDNPVSQPELFSHVRDILRCHPECAPVGYLLPEYWAWNRAEIKQN